MAAANKLNVEGAVKKDETVHFPLRILKDLDDWIEENSTGSRNSVINFLVHIGINQIQNILSHDSIYESVSMEEDEE
jgi:hypothetical protein